ncbi:hypothetical protein ADH72_01785 [Akkermansia muciniphila]|jgi:hypothetical protein|uniref:Uncharacterized protein n=1 Tax=Akkermansia muciniphila TaxID=239935 RepID=A0AAX0WI28_9BACT|nr:hypothetical protein A4V05_06065 [Akkermansia muciniphila]ASB34517.1 hypothetical protein ADH72_01785 [Akkermansia muciniphila]PND00423.1 hypothetical protein CXT95_09365 [Akkermansia muciniphila]
MASVSAGKEERGRLETLRFPDVRKNRRKGLSVGNSVPGPRFLRPGEGGPQSPDRTGRQLRTDVFLMAGKQILRQAVLAGG